MIHLSFLWCNTCFFLYEVVAPPKGPYNEPMVQGYDDSLFGEAAPNNHSKVKFGAPHVVDLGYLGSNTMLMLLLVVLLLLLVVLLVVAKSQVCRRFAVWKRQMKIDLNVQLNDDCDTSMLRAERLQ